MFQVVALEPAVVLLGFLHRSTDSRIPSYFGAAIFRALRRHRLDRPRCTLLGSKDGLFQAAPQLCIPRMSKIFILGRIKIKFRPRLLRCPVAQGATGRLGGHDTAAPTAGGVVLPSAVFPAARFGRTAAAGA